LFDGSVTDETNIYEHFMGLPQMRTRMNPYVYQKPTEITWMDQSQLSDEVLASIQYINKGKIYWVYIIHNTNIS
jgi:hypothetical protein